MAETRPKLEFATNIPVPLTLGKNFKSGTGEWGAWHGWNVIHDGVEKVVFAKDALHNMIKQYEEGTKLTITYAERKGADGKPFHEWQVGSANGDGPPPWQKKPEHKVEYQVASLNLEAHLLACAEIAKKIAVQLKLEDDQAIQACFATVAIDAQRHNVILGDSSPSEPSEPQEDSGQREALLKGVKSACKLLNDEGYEPRFTPKRLKEFVAEEFGCGLDELGIEGIEQLMKTLSDKLDNFRLNKTIDSEPIEDVPFRRTDAKRITRMAGTAKVCSHLS